MGRVDSSDEVGGVVWRERVITWLLMFAFVVGFPRGGRELLMVVLLTLVGVALGWPLITLWVGRAAPSQRARSLRRAALVVTPLGVLLASFAMQLFDGWMGIDESTIGIALVIGLIAPLFAELIVARIVPPAWRPEHDRWTPRAITRRSLVLVWLLPTLLAFVILTSFTGDDGCVVDATCEFGFPIEHVSSSEGYQKLDWGLLWFDIVVFASLVPAGHGLIRSALRPVFALYLLLITLVFGGLFIARKAEFDARLWLELMGSALVEDKTGPPDRRRHDRPRGGSTRNFPDHVALGSPDCRLCAAREHQRCGVLFRYECPSGGTCGRDVACDPACCGLETSRRVGLDEAPWGPILATAATDERPPIGVLAYADQAEMLVARPATTAVDPRAWGRVDQPIEAWAWSKAQRVALFVGTDATHPLVRWDTRSGLELAKLATPSFAIDPSGERVAFVQAPESYGPSTLVVLELASSSTEHALRWEGDVLGASWQPERDAIAISYVDNGTAARIRVVELATQTFVDSPPDLGDLREPIWHPSGSFLASWQHDDERCVLVFVTPEGLHHAPTPLAFEPTSCPTARFSPDGRHLALAHPSSSSARGRVDLVKVSALDQPWTLLTHEARGLNWLTDAEVMSLRNP
jgi:hypothetical protein